MSEKVVALVQYYAREKYARQLQTVCNELLKKRSNDPLMLFWRAYGLLLEGSTTEAIIELKSLIGNQDLDLAASAALILAHESAKVVDHDEVTQLSMKLELEERGCSEEAALHLASFYVHSRSKEQARSLVDRVLTKHPDNHTALIQQGWIIIAQQQDEEYEMMQDASELDVALQNFEVVLDANDIDLQALLGKSKVLELKKELGPAIDVLNEIIVKFSWFSPALVEKCRLLMAMGDWENVSETLTRILQADPNNFMALSWSAMVAITREGNNKIALKHLADAMAALARQEPRNAELYHRLSKPFARLAGMDQSLLAHAATLADRAVFLKNDSAPYLVELGYVRLMQDDPAGAGERFNAAAALDELNLGAAAGLVEVALANGELIEATSQVIFLEEMYNHSTILNHSTTVTGDPPQLLYLKGLLAWKQGNTQDGQTLLERCIARLFEASGELPPSLDMFAVLNPGRITAIIRLLLGSLGSEPRAATEAPSPLLSKCNRALDMLSRVAPCFMEASLLHARALFLNGALDAAARKAADILRMNAEDYNAHLLLCSIYVYQDKQQLALSALEQAVSVNLTVRDTPLYAIVNAKVLITSGKLEEAAKVLESAMGMPGVRSKLTAQQRTRITRRIIEASLSERATIYLLSAEVASKLSKLPDAPEAKKFIADAMREFEGTSEEVRVTVADCDLAIARGDVEGALRKLRKVPPTSPHYTRARMAMADIYLKHRHDKGMYVKSYYDLVNQTPDYDTFCMLGEAFMQIQEPEKAAHAYENALEYSQKDVDLMSKIAQALVISHDYQRAIDYFNKAIRHSQNPTALQLELSKLLMRLRQWAAAAAWLNKTLERGREGAGSVDNLTTDVDAWALLAQVYKGSGDSDGYVSATLKCMELQKQVISRTRGELPEVVAASRERAAGFCYDLAEHHKRNRKFDKAMELYNEGLRLCDSHGASMLSLARLHLAGGDTDACQAQCVSLLKHDPDNDEASIMLAELMFHKEHYDNAIYHFQQLLERNPNHYVALSQLVGLMRRAGRLDDVPKYLEQAEELPKAMMDPGLHFCKGLYARYTNNPREALRCFNLARKDSKWGSQAILHMVEVYLNPDNDAVWAEQESGNPQETAEAVQTARSLLEQVRGSETGSQRYKVLECYALMASKEKVEVEAALGKLLDMTNQDPNNVPVLLAMATGFMILKQTSKARNQLKRVQKIQYKADEAEEFERSWLLLADIHIQGGKFDLAHDLCQRCLKYNKSCAKAWEMMGAIMEREQAYKDAADHYEKAWKFENMASAQVGYKLAFNYLKAKRFVDAIDVCHKVIKAFPEYPKIRKDILEKARSGLKP